MIKFSIYFFPPADSYTNLFGPVSPKVCTLNYNRNDTLKTLSPFSRCDHLGVVLCQKLPRSQCTGDHSMISSSSNSITKISMLRPRNSKTFTSCLWWIFKCHRVNMMSRRQAWWNQSKVYQWKDSAVPQCGCSGEIEAARTHRFPSESDAVVEQCYVVSRHKKSTNLRQA